MWPWGHLALGYLCYAALVGVWERRSPRGWPVVALAVGTQFPDLVDKPLTYWWAVLPEARSLTHSAVLFLPLALVLVVLAWNYRRTRSGVAFSVGWGTHLVGDSVLAVHQGAYGQLSFLLWPLRPAPEYEAPDFAFHARKLLDSLAQLEADALLAPGEDLFVLQLWLAGVMFLVWVAQGMPPLWSLGRWLRRAVADPEPG